MTPATMPVPSFTQGFARSPGEAVYPQLWHGLVGAWCPSVGVQGATLFDFAPYANHGALTNMSPGDDWVVGQRSYLLDFDGTDDSVQVPDAPHLDVGPYWSLAFRLNKAVGSAYGAVVSRYQALPGLGFVVYVGSVSAGSIVVFDDGFSATTSSDYLAEGVEHDVVLVRRNQNAEVNPSELDVWVDGRLRETLSLTGATTANAEPLTIGETTGAERFTGRIGDVLFWDRQLAPGEIELMARGGSFLHRRPLRRQFVPEAEAARFTFPLRPRLRPRAFAPGRAR